MKIFFVLFFSVLQLFLTQAYEIKGEFINKADHSQIIEGEAFDGYIRIWPFQNEDLNLLKKELDNKTFLDFFHIVKVYDAKYSQNNEEVLEIYVKAVLINAYKPRDFYIWTYKSLTIPFEVKNINPVKNPNGKEYIVQKQSFNPFSSSNKWFPFIVLICFGIVVILIVGASFVIKKNKIKANKERLVKEWAKTFHSAETRSDFEKIYKSKSQWLNEIGGETPPILHFLTTINSIQYKKEWNEFEDLQVKDSFDEIRGIFGRI